MIIARELSGDPKVLLVAQPTRGLDVGSIEFIHRRIVEMRDAGTAVLLVSAELDEIFALADRIGVLFHGELVGEFDRDDATRTPSGSSWRPATGPRRGRRERDAMDANRRRAAARAAGLRALRAALLRPPAGARPDRRDLARLPVGQHRDPARRREPARGVLGADTRNVGSRDRIAASLGRSTPFIGAALAVAFAFRAGLFNIGVEGQLLVGATAAAWVGTWAWVADVPGPVAIFIVLVAGVVGGMLYGAIPGVLKAATGAHEVITTIMLNAIAVLYVRWLVSSQDP